MCEVDNFEIAKLILEFLRVLIWPATVLVVLLLFRSQVVELFKRVKKADLPGGFSFETFPEQLEEAKDLSLKVKGEKPAREKERNPIIPITEANAKMLNLGLSPSPSGLEISYYRALAEQDPNLALAGLRIELEAMLKNLAKGFKVSINDRDSASVISQKLKEQGAITSHQHELLLSVIGLCNAAVHGNRVTIRQAEEVLDIASMLIDQYVSWLSWGFDAGANEVKHVQ
ncbi:MAG: hypothetical protein HZA22_10235 [Nitrospirae bacterium]|nr:hypothetical protein [Nitrospirota bacterium]